MTPAVCRKLTPETLQRVYSQHLIPRPESVEAYPEERGIDGLFGALEHEKSDTHPKEILIDWGYLANLARSGELGDFYKSLLSSKRS